MQKFDYQYDQCIQWIANLSIRIQVLIMKYNSLILTNIH